MKSLKEEWDRDYRTIPLEEIPWHTGKPEKILVELVEKGGIEKGKVMDLCSGDGTNSIYLASQGFEVSGVDISPAAVKIAGKACAEKGVKCDYKSGDVLKLNTKGKYDFVFDRGCFHHIPPGKKKKYVEIAAGLLNKKGKMLLFCFSDRNRGLEKALSKQDIKEYFGKDFDIKFIRETTHKEPGGSRMFLYSVFMEKY